MTKRSNADTWNRRLGNKVAALLLTVRIRPHSVPPVMHGSSRDCESTNFIERTKFSSGQSHRFHSGD